MDIQFKGTKYDPTPEIIELASKKIKALTRFLGKDGESTRAFIELERAVGSQNKGDVWRAELNIDHDGKRFRAESTKAKLDHAVKTAIEDVARELRRTNKHQHDLVRKGGGAVKDFLRGFGKH